MNAKQARERQKVIEQTLTGLYKMLVEDKTLLAEMDPDQEDRFAKLLGVAVHKGLADL